MTLIAALILDNRSYMICDKMHSIDGTESSPVTATIATDTGMKINIKSHKIRMTSGTKVYRVNQEKVLIGGAGDLNKMKF